jgi:hypothetical protein
MEGPSKDEPDELDEQPLKGCKYAFRCLILFLLLFALTFPFSAYFLLPNPRDWASDRSLSRPHPTIPRVQRNVGFPPSADTQPKVHFRPIADIAPLMGEK